MTAEVAGQPTAGTDEPTVRVAKPLDVGNGLVAASFGVDGTWLSLGRPHPVHGFVELSGLPPFDETWRGDPVAVRRYRQWMTEEWTGFLRWELPGDAGPTAVRLDPDGRPEWTRRGPDRSAVLTVSTTPDRPAVTQHLWLGGEGGPAPVTLRLSGHLARCAFAEITEVDPPPPAPPSGTLRADGARVWVEAPGLPAVAVVTVVVSAAPPGTPDVPYAWTVDGAGAWLAVDLPVGSGLAVTVELLVDEPPVTAAPPARAVAVPAPRPGGESAVPVPRPPEASTAPAQRPAEESAVPVQGPPGESAAPARTPGRGRRPAARVLDLITRGAVAYVLDCTALAVGDGERVLLADHRQLPLSWTRDAYYQALLLLVAAPQRDRARRVVAEHLRWLWGPGRPADGVWQRSHFASGRAKDAAVQADQQLYPLLELLDFRRFCGRWPAPPGAPAADPARAWGALVADAWDRLPRGEVDGLLVSEENPADDPAELPYALSTQILYWYTATRLVAYAAELGLRPDRFASVASALPGAIARHFTVSGPYGPQWAYESDGRDPDGASGSDGRPSGRRLYQDANDLPTALAPAYGFCPPDDQRWRATMRFAFSPHNPAYASGPYGGLGSAHTPGVWSLGDAQELAVALLTRDRGRLAAVIARMERVVGVDGLLPEAYCPRTGEWLARHWFAWPAAAIGVLCRGGIRRLRPIRTATAGQGLRAQ